VKIVINKNDFFEVLKKFPELQEAYTEDFYQKYAKKEEGQKKLKIVLKKNEFLPSRMVVWVSYLSDVFEVEYEPHGLVRYKFIEKLKKKGKIV